MFNIKFMDVLFKIITIQQSCPIASFNKNIAMMDLWCFHRNPYFLLETVYLYTRFVYGPKELRICRLIKFFIVEKYSRTIYLDNI